MKRLVLVLAVTMGTGLANAGCEDDPTDLDFTKPKASQADGGVHHDGGSSSADSGSAGSGGADSGSAGSGSSGAGGAGAGGAAGSSDAGH